MEHAKTFEEYQLLNELVDVTNQSEFDTAKRDKTEIQVLWGNGHVVAKPDIKDATKYGLNTVSFIMDFKAEIVKGTFMDDWSDFKGIKQIQQFLSDLLKANVITKKWKFNIYNSGASVKKNFGGNTIDKVLKYDSNFDTNIPRAFHGTSDYYIEEIKKKGLVPRYYSDAIPNWDKGYTNKSDKLIYLSMDIERADYYAQMAVSALEKNKDIKSKPIIIEIRNLPIESVTADDDFMTNMGQINLMHYIKTGKQIDPNNYISGIRSSSQFAHNGRIPSKMIHKIHKSKRR